MTLYDRVLEELEGDYGRGPTNIAASLCISKAQARRVLQALLRDGMAEFGCIMSEWDGKLQGRGYCISLEGRKYLNERRRNLLYP